MPGKGGGGEVVGEVIVKIVADASELPSDVAEAAENLESSSGGKGTGRRAARDVAGAGKDVKPTVTNVDAKVKTKIDSQVAKDVQSALDQQEFGITLDTDSIRQQVELALKRAFDITVNVKTGEGTVGEAVANVGASPSPEVATGAPVGRGPAPQELTRQMTEGVQNAINNSYRNLNEILAQANKPRFGKQGLGPGNEVEKALELMNQFGGKFNEFLDIDWSSPIGKTRGGSMSPEALAETFGVPAKSETMDTLQEALRGFTVPAPEGQSPSRAADVFLSQVRRWAEDTPEVAQVSNAQSPVVKQVVQTAAETAARTPDPQVEERIAASEEENRQTREALSSEASQRLRIRSADLPAGYVGLNAPLGRPQHPLRPQDVETELAAQQALGGGERANPRRFSQRVPVEEVAGIPLNLEPLLRLAAMGRYSGMFEEFGGKGNKESLGKVQIEADEPVGLEELNRLRAPGRPGVKRQSGGRTFSPIKPRQAFTEDVIQMMGIGEDAASMDAVEAFLNRPEVALEITKNLAVGSNPRRAARSSGTPGGPSSATKRGQGSTGYAGIGTGGDLGRDAMRVIEWIDELEGRIASTTDVMERLNDDISRTSGTGQDITGLEAQQRDLGKELQKLRRKRTDAIRERASLLEEGAPADARTIKETDRFKGEQSKERVEEGAGLSPAEKARKGFLSPATTGARQADLLQSLGLSGPEVVQNMLRQRFLAEPSRVRAGTGKDISTGEEEQGRILTGTTALRETAFGSSKRRKGGLFGELTAMLPEDMGKNARKEAEGAIRDLLEGIVQAEGEARTLLEEDVARKEPMSGPRKFMSDVSPQQARERGYTGEGQFRYAPGQQAALEADIETNEARKARLAEIDKILRPRTVTRPAIPASAKDKGRGPVTEEILEPDRRFSGENIEKLKQERRVLKSEYTNPDELRRRLAESQARQPLEAAEATTTEATKAKTQGRRMPITGEESVAMAVGRVTMEEPEAPPLPFAGISAEYGLAGRASAAGGAGGGGRPPRGRPPTFDEQPEEPEGGGPEFPAGGGAIPVIVTNWPEGFGAGGGAPGPDVRQREIVGASRQIAELGAQTSAEFQDAFRMEAQRLTQAGMKAADVRKMAEKAGLGSAAAMYYGTMPAEAAEQAPGKEPEGPRMTEFGPEFRVLPEDVGVKTTARQRALEAEEKKPALTPTALPYDYKVVTTARQRALEKEAAAPPLTPTPQGVPMRIVNSPQQREVERQEAEMRRQAAEAARQAAQQTRDQERAARRQAQETRRMARTNDPVGFARNQDLEDARQREMRGQLRTMNRVIPKRGFGASLTDLITSGVPFTDALERQLEAQDLATREATEMRSVGTKRAQTRTVRQNLIPQIRAERAGRGFAGAPTERETQLLSQYREQVTVGKQQNAIMRESSARFRGFNAEATKGTTVLKAFSAAAIGSIGSIGVGALTFGIGSAIVAPLITAIAEAVEKGVAPEIDKMVGFGATATRITGELAKETRAQGGAAEGAVAGFAAQTGIGASAFRQISQPIIDRAAVQAGNQALKEQLDLLHTSQNLQRDNQDRRGFDKGLTGTIAGVGGTELFGEAPTSQILTGELARLPQLRSAQDQTRIDEIKREMQEPQPGRKMQALNAELLDLSSGLNKLSDEDLKKVSETLGIFNGALEKSGSSARVVQDKQGDLAEATAKAADQLNLPDLAQTLRDQSIGITGVKTPEDLLKALEDISTGAPAPAPELLLQTSRRERGVQMQQGIFARRFQTDTVGPQTTAMALAQRPPTDTSSIDLTGAGGSRSALKKDLKETQGLYKDINREIKLGTAAAIDFVTNGADIQGLGNDIGGLGAKAGKEFADSLALVAKYGKQIQGIELGLETKQAAYQAAQFSYQIGIAKRNLADAKGLAGQLTNAGKENLGVIEREIFMLQRRSQLLSMDLAQRQINFQKAVAGFSAPGVTPEETQARVKEAKLEAEYQQKQLDIQKKLFALQGRGFQITSTRQVRDLQGQLDLLERGRVISLETAAAEKKIKALTILQEKENKKVTAFYEAAITRTNDIIGLIGNIANAAKKSMSDVADAVLDEMEQFVDGIEDEMEQFGDSIFENEPEDRGPEGSARHRAAGGNVMAGIAHLVGEQGPEMFTPGENGLITPLSYLAGMGGGGGSSNNITNISIMVTGNNVSSEEELRKLEQRITDAVEKAQGRKLSLLGGRAY